MLNLKVEGKVQSGTVVFIGDWRMAATLSARTTRSEELLQKHAKFLERSENELYHMRRNYAQGTALQSSTSSIQPHHRPIVTEAPKTEPRDPGPFLGIGYCSNSVETPQRDIPIPQKPATHALLSRLPKTPGVVRVKSLELPPNLPKPVQTLEAWTKSEFYNSCLAFVSTQKESKQEVTELPNSSLETAVVRTAPKQIKRCSCAKDFKETAVHMKPVAEHKESSVKLTTVTIPLQTDACALPERGLKPRAMPPRLAASKSAILKPQAKPVGLPPAPPQPAHASKPLKKSHTQELPPKDLPPYRIPVDYGLFRNVCKSCR